MLRLHVVVGVARLLQFDYICDMKTMFLFLASFIFFFTSCSVKEKLDDNSFDLAALRSNVWAVDHVDFNTFDTQGNLVGTEKYPFGEGTNGGICTFTYDKDNIWTLDDNGEIFTTCYSIDDRMIYTDGGGTWELRKLNENNLELFLRSDQTFYSRNYAVSGAVYYLYH